jgi:hypothetical protein
MFRVRIRVVRVAPREHRGGRPQKGAGVQRSEKGLMSGEHWVELSVQFRFFWKEGGMQGSVERR